MLANVNEQLWIDYDLDTAIFLDTIAFWIKKNAANKQPRNFQDGRYWTYNSATAYEKIFPGWKRETIRRIIRNCVKNDLLIVGNYNKKGYDRTNWYTLTDKALQYYPLLAKLMHVIPDNLDPDSLVGSNPPLVDSNQAIPTLLPSSSNNTITTSKRSSSKSQSLEFMWALIAVYAKIFPNNPQPHPRALSTNLHKTLQTLIKRWPELSNGEKLDIEAFERYLTLLRDTAPRFSLGEYTTTGGNIKKNSMETFCRWNTIVKFLENQYS